MTIYLVSHKKRLCVKIADFFVVANECETDNGICYCWVESGGKKKKRIGILNTCHFYPALGKNSPCTSNNKAV